MRLLPSLLACLVAGAAATVAAAAAPVPIQEAITHDGAIRIQDGFLDADARATLLDHFDSDATCDAEAGRRKHLPVHRSLSDRIWAAIAGAAPIDKGEEEVAVPTYQFLGDTAEHQDRYASGPHLGQVVDGRVGVAWLEGDGSFVFKHVETGDEHRVAVQPGRLITWPNRYYTHRVEGATPSVPRRTLGPLTLEATTAGTGFVGVGITGSQCTAFDNQLCLQPNYAGSISAGVATSGPDCMIRCFQSNSAYIYSSFWGTCTS